MLNILVVEDHRVQRNNLMRMLKSLNKDIKIFEAATGEEAIKILKQETIELFFLDIELPDMSGLKIAETIRSTPKYELAYIVFITTHVHYQLEAFKNYHCYDFIEKPYEHEEVFKISDRLIRGIKHNESQNEAVRFKTKNCILKLYIKEILFIESQGKNCIIHTRNNQYTIPNISLKTVLEKTATTNFMQTHKSYIINLENIDLIEKREKNSWIVYFNDYHSPAYISNHYKEESSNRFESKL